MNRLIACGFGEAGFTFEFEPFSVEDEVRNMQVDTGYVTARCLTPLATRYTGPAGDRRPLFSRRRRALPRALGSRAQILFADRGWIGQECTTRLVVERTMGEGSRQPEADRTTGALVCAGQSA